jgi:hypothetical protein
MRPRAGAFVAIALVFASAGADASPALHATARLEAGAEHDTNPARTETVEGVTAPNRVGSSPLGRFAATGDVAAVLGEGFTLSLGGGFAGKGFVHADARPEDVLVADARSHVAVALGASTTFALDATYYEIFQRSDDVQDARDFRSVLPAARLEQRVGAAQLYAGAGYRSLTWKPAPELDFAGATAFLGYRQQRAVPLGEEGAEWEWGAAASVDLRTFGGPRCESLDACRSDGTPETRRDRFVVAQVDATRTGDVLLGAGFALHLNESNSFGESLRRVIGHVRGVFLLPAGFSLATRLELVATTYADPVPVGHDATTDRYVPLEQESRSTLRAELTHPLGALVDAGLRYTYYTSAPSSGPVAFQRQTFLLYLAVVLER